MVSITVKQRLKYFFLLSINDTKKSSRYMSFFSCLEQHVIISPKLTFRYQIVAHLIYDYIYQEHI